MKGSGIEKKENKRCYPEEITKKQREVKNSEKRTKTRLIIDDTSIYEVDIECEKCRHKGCFGK